MKIRGRGKGKQPRGWVHCLSLFFFCFFWPPSSSSFSSSSCWCCFAVPDAPSHWRRDGGCGASVSGSSRKIEDVPLEHVVKALLALVVLLLVLVLSAASPPRQARAASNAGHGARCRGGGRLGNRGGLASRKGWRLLQKKSNREVCACEPVVLCACVCVCVFALSSFCCEIELVCACCFRGVFVFAVGLLVLAGDRQGVA